MHQGSTVGLDFGTSTTLVASAAGVVPIGHSSTSMPSLVGYGDDGLAVVGEPALDVPPDQTVRSVKRWITEHRQFVRLDTPVGVRDLRADDLIVELLREAAARATLRGQDLGARGRLRLGCPAMWDGSQRRRLLDAARRAGLPVTLASFVDEPVAAGIAWLSDQPGATGPLRVLVFDMGGGTLDIAVLDVRDNDVSVLAALGVPEAGDALDRAIAEDLDYALTLRGIDVDGLADPERARERLLDAAREAKIALTTDTRHVVVLPPRLFGPAELWYTREQLDAVFSPQLDRAEQYVAAALRAALLTEQAPGAAHDIARVPIDPLVDAVDAVVLSGGMSQIPYVAQRMREFFTPDTRIELAARPSDHAVAVGLGRAAGYGRINMYRPPFDVLVEWDKGRQRRTLYEAFTPLVEVRQIVQGGDDLRFVRRGADLALPRGGHAQLRVVSHSGERVEATIGGGSLDGFPVALNEHGFEFSIYPNGRLRLTDGQGVHNGHVADWHTMNTTTS